MATQLLAGAARADITPPVGVTMGGFAARVEGATGVHDPLWAKALVLRSGDVTLALVACDLLGLTADVLTPARDDVEAECGIPADHVMIACTHTHSGPDTLCLFRESPSPGYFALLRRQMVAAVRDAKALLRPAKAGWGRGRVDGISVNRRTFDKGPLDTEVGVLRIEDGTQQPLALVVNFACHPVTLGGDNLLLSADFPGFAMTLLEQVDPGCVALFLNGAFGNVNTGHRKDLDVGDRGERTFARTRALGHMLAGEALKVHNTILCQSDLTLGARTVPLRLRTRNLPDADWAQLQANVDKAEQVLNDAAASRDAKVKAQCGPLYDRELLFLKAALPADIASEVMALRVGDGVLAGVPAEYFIEYQIALKQSAPRPFTFLAAPVNDWIGYAPTPAAFADGGYETQLCRWSKLAPECGDQVFDALLTAAREV